MCGIAGCLGNKSAGIAWPHLLEQLGSALRHRGPDDGGAWWDENAGVGLAHRRLSIVDLSSEGRQPMLSRSGRFLLSYNGEIYNFRDLRNQLDVPFRGQSDTEVLLAAIEEWGLDTALEESVGMFAFALWDRETRTLSLVRDRAGVKPLYVGLVPGGLVFGSELKALRAHPAFAPEIDRESLTLLFRYGYIPAPYSIYASTWKVEPGSILEIRSDSAAQPDRWSGRSYWSAQTVFEQGQRNPLGPDPEHAVSALEDLLMQAVGDRMVADVPLGAFLSGGIDSSTVVALMQAQSDRPVKTFSIGFDEAGYDEAPAAKAVARSLGTDHTELYVTPQKAMDTIPLLPHIYDEPFADSSQLPTLLVSQLARRHVTVSLSGDGGDEFFFGYERYLYGDRLHRRISAIPRPLREGVGRLLHNPSEEGWNRALRYARLLTPRSVARRLRGDNVHLLAEYLQLSKANALYRRIQSLWTRPGDLVIGGVEPPTVFSADHENARADWDFPRLMMYLDTVSYLPDDILVKVDRASMAVSLEARNPFLDHRVIEFAARTPLDLKVRAGKGKWIVREVLNRHVPRQLFDRPKKGFSVPVAHWLRGPLREWAEHLLDPNRLRTEGYLDASAVHAIWREHLDGTFNREAVLWTALMFQSWLESRQETLADVSSEAASAQPEADPLASA